MGETLTSGEISATFETTREFYQGVLAAVNRRLDKLPVATRHQVQSVDFNLAGEANNDSTISLLRVGRTLEDETLPLVFVGTEPEQEAAFEIRPDGGLVGAGFAGKSPTDLMNDMLPLLPTLETTEASAIVRLPKL